MKKIYCVSCGLLIKSNSKSFFITQEKSYCHKCITKGRKFFEPIGDDKMKVPYIIRDKRPTTCEMWLNIKGDNARKCTRPIDFIYSASGGFVCSKCAQRMHKRDSKSGKFYDAEKYLKKYPL